MKRRKPTTKKNLKVSEKRIQEIYSYPIFRMFERKSLTFKKSLLISFTYRFFYRREENRSSTRFPQECWKFFSR